MLTFISGGWGRGTVRVHVCIMGRFSNLTGVFSRYGSNLTIVNTTSIDQRNRSSDFTDERTGLIKWGLAYWASQVFLLQRL